jgi:hypothetical protein
LSVIDEGYELNAFEFLPKEKHQYRVELLIQQTRTNYMFYKSQVAAAQSRILHLDERMTKAELQLAVFRFLRPALRAPDIAANITRQLNEEEQLKLEFSQMFGEEEEPPYTLAIHNNLRSNEYTMFGSMKKPRCEYCHEQHSDDCELPENRSLKDLIQGINQSTR